MGSNPISTNGNSLHERSVHSCAFLVEHTDGSGKVNHAGQAMRRELLLSEMERLIASQEAHRREIDQHLLRLKELRDKIAIPETTSEGDNSKTHFERIVEFLKEQDNRPQSIRAIAEATRLKRKSLAQVVYRTHRESFVATASPGHGKKKLWSLTDAVLREATGQVRPTLFGRDGDLAGVSAKECCVRILREHGNLPMNALTLARQALRRGYIGGTEGSEDDVLMTTAKSFWARLGRDERFQEVRPQVFVLVEELAEPPKTPTSEAEDTVRFTETDVEGQDMEGNK